VFPALRLPETPTLAVAGRAYSGLHPEYAIRTKHAECLEKFHFPNNKAFKITMNFYAIAP
jgi:hypothetical protein